MQDIVNWAGGVPKQVTHTGPMITSVKYKTKKERNIMMNLVRAKPWPVIRSSALKTVDDKGIFEVEFSLIPSDELKPDDECILLAYLSKRAATNKSASRKRFARKLTWWST